MMSGGGSGGRRWVGGGRWEVVGSDISMQWLTCEACWTGWWNICMDFTFFVVFRNGISTVYTCAGVCRVHTCVLCVYVGCTRVFCVCMGCVCEGRWVAQNQEQCRK